MRTSKIIRSIGCLLKMGRENYADRGDFLYLDDTMDNNDDNVQEVEKDTEVCRDLFRLWLVFFIF